MKTLRLIHHLVITALVIGATLMPGQELKPIQLPVPHMEGGKPLMEVLKDRRTIRSFSGKELPAQVLSNLLWAAFGINRPESGLRTAPSASNRQEIDIYVALASGLYLYQVKEHLLKPVLPDDIRAMTGTQDFVGKAPVNLVFVADNEKGRRRSVENEVFYAGADTGFISQNVYLFCASEGLATVVRGLVNREALSKKMGLKPDQRITLVQTVGYPAE